MRWYVPVGLAIVIVIVSAVFLLQPSAPAPVDEQQELLVRELGSEVVESVGTSVTITENYFAPDTYTLPAGKGLTLVILSRDEERTLSIPATGQTITVPADEPYVFTTPALAKGTLTLYCTSGCDTDVSMTVTIE